MLKVACVGAGWVTMNRHVKAVRRHPRLRLAGIIDRTPERAKAAARSLGVPAATGFDASWMTDVGAVLIGTPPETHHALVLEALSRGLHVLVEKPFAMSEAQALEMIAASRAAGRVLAVVHNFQFARSVAEARRRFQTGEAGELKSVLGLQLSSHSRRLPEWYRELPGGLFYDEAAHLFYLVRSFIPELPLTRVHVTPSRTPSDNTPVLVSTIHESPHAVGAVQMFFDSALSEWQLVLMGSKETLVADIFRDILLRLPSDRSHAPRDILSTSAFATGGHLLGTLTSGVRHVLGTLDYGNDEVVRRFVAAIEDGREPVGIAASDGLAVVRAMQAVVAELPPSIRNGPPARAHPA